MQNLGVLANIWRYPVKSLAGEALESTRVEREGIPGDRSAALFVEDGHARSGKTYRGKENNLLHTTAQAERARALANERGVTVSLRSSAGERYFDDSPISLIFDRWIDQVERALTLRLDPLRWRPNFYARAAADSSFEESALLGATIEIGEVVLRVTDRIGRCVTPNYDIATGEPNDAVLRYVAVERANTMGVYCEVERAGTVRAGDALRLRER